jgi:hypothetical protein
MSTSTSRITFITMIPLFLLCQGRSASAQCTSNSLQYGNIALQAANPFQAEYSTSITPPLPLGRGSLPQSSVYSVARDSQGRVRSDHAAGKFNVKPAASAETDEEQQLVTICDPISQKVIRLDTLNKIATVATPRVITPRPLPEINPAPQPFCSTHFKRFLSNPRFQTADLGNKLISGVEAHGLRWWLLLPATADSPAQPSPTYQEDWCSEDLGIMVMHASVSTSVNRRTETILKNIERSEPDAALFQIPPDYTIEQRVMPARPTPLLRPLSPPSTPNPPQ